jgi:hypothetical protein
LKKNLKTAKMFTISPHQCSMYLVLLTLCMNFSPNLGIWAAEWTPTKLQMDYRWDKDYHWITPDIVQLKDLARDEPYLFVYITVKNCPHELLYQKDLDHLYRQWNHMKSRVKFVRIQMDNPVALPEWGLDKVPASIIIFEGKASHINLKHSTIKLDDNLKPYNVFCCPIKLDLDRRQFRRHNKPD